MKKSMFRELHALTEPVKEPGKAKVFSEETVESIKEADEIIKKETKKKEKKNGRKFTI